MTDVGQEKGQTGGKGRSLAGGRREPRALKSWQYVGGAAPLSGLAGKDNQGVPAPLEVFPEHPCTPPNNAWPSLSCSRFDSELTGVSDRSLVPLYVKNASLFRSICTRCEVVRNAESQASPQTF